MRILLLLLAAFSATIIPVQAIINGRLGQMVANPFLAAMVSFVGGTAALAVVILVSTPGLPRLPTDLQWSDIPPYLLTGGLFGAYYVTIVLTLVPRIGAASVVAAGIVGQLVSSVLIDHFGALGITQRPVSPGTIVGCVLLIAGMLLIQRG